MIIKTYPNKNRYGKYFLAMEAPEDETVTEDQPKPKRNVKVITVKPSNRRKDFTDIGTDEPEDTESTTTDETENTSQQDVDQTEEANDPTPQEEETEDTTSEEGGETGEDGPDTGDGDNTDFADTAENDESTNDDTSEEGGETGEDGPDTGDGDNTDFADTGTEETGDQPQQEQNTAETNKGHQLAPGVEFDSTRKYNLFKEYMSLYNACDNYISKLENVLKNDYDENQIIRISVTNLREIRDILSDYMTIRYQLNSYVQSLLFYQKMVVAVQLVFNLLKSINTK